MTLTTPKLPPNQFFRVKRINWSRYPLEVQLRRKHLIGSTEIGSTLSNNSPESIHRSMLRLLDCQQQRAQARKTDNAFCGDYPPKTLENQ